MTHNYETNFPANDRLAAGPAALLGDVPDAPEVLPAETDEPVEAGDADTDSRHVQMQHSGVAESDTGSDTALAAAIPARLREVGGREASGAAPRDPVPVTRKIAGPLPLPTRPKVAPDALVAAGIVHSALTAGERQITAHSQSLRGILAINEAVRVGSGRPSLPALTTEQWELFAAWLPSLDNFTRQVVTLTVGYELEPEQASRVLVCELDAVHIALNTAAMLRPQHLHMGESSKQARLVELLKPHFETRLLTAPFASVCWQPVEHTGQELHSGLSGELHVNRLCFGIGRIAVRDSQLAPQKKMHGILATLGLTNMQIGSALQLSEGTIKGDFKEVFRTRGVAFRAALLRSFVLDGTYSVEKAANPLQLTKREADVLQLLYKGLSNPLIGQALSLGEDTIKTHVKKMLGRNNLTNRHQLITAAYLSGQIE